MATSVGLSTVGVKVGLGVRVGSGVGIGVPERAHAVSSNKLTNTTTLVRWLTIRLLLRINFPTVPHTRPLTSGKTWPNPASTVCGGTDLPERSRSLDGGSLFYHKDMEEAKPA